MRPQQCMGVTRRPAHWIIPLMVLLQSTHQVEVIQFKDSHVTNVMMQFLEITIRMMSHTWECSLNWILLRVLQRLTLEWCLSYAKQHICMHALKTPQPDQFLIGCTWWNIQLFSSYMQDDIAYAWVNNFLCINSTASVIVQRHFNDCWWAFNEWFLLKIMKL